MTKNVDKARLKQWEANVLPVEDDEYYDETDWSEAEPDGYECMSCGNIQEYGYGMTCRKCMGPCDEFYF